MTFLDILAELDFDGIRRQIAYATDDQVERLLQRDTIDDGDLPILFSPAADRMLEQIAARSAAITERRFGRVIQLYAPVYMSNQCINRCRYCGLAQDHETPRLTLSPQQVASEADILHQQGFRHILLVSGEWPALVNQEYLAEVARLLSRKFASISIEINPLGTEQYTELAYNGIDGLAIYQETYDHELYLCMHPTGPKRCYKKRILSMESGGQAGFRSLGIGALLGLGDWRLEAVLLALHGRYLANRFWHSRVSVSFPRIRMAEGGFEPPSPVSDRSLVHMICATRLALPDAELVLSTREPAWLRDRMIGLGITRMSAGSCTNPGGYTHEPGDTLKQFEIDDNRPPDQVAAVIDAKGCEPVWKDFDRTFVVTRQ